MNVRERSNYTSVSGRGMSHSAVHRVSMCSSPGTECWQCVAARECSQGHAPSAPPSHAYTEHAHGQQQEPAAERAILV